MHKKRGLARKILSIVLIVVIPWSGSSVIWAQTAFGTAATTAEDFWSLFAEKSLPSKLGSIEEIYQIQKDDKTPTILLIEDAHSNASAQESIQKIIQFISTRWNIHQVGVEGVSSHMEPSLFRAFPVKKILNKIFKDYVLTNDIGGAAAAAVLGTEEVSFYGLEEEKLYEKSVSLYLQAMEQKKKWEKELSTLKKELDARKKIEYSKELSETEKMFSRFGKNEFLKSDFKKLENLLRAQKLQNQLPFLSALFTWHALDSEFRLDSHRIKSISKAIKKIPLRRAQRIRLQSEEQAFKTGKSSGASWLALCETVSRAHERPILLNQSEKRWLRLWKENKKLNRQRFSEEWEAFQDKTKYQMATTREEKALLEEEKCLNVLQKWTRLELSSREWKFLERNQSKKQLSAGLKARIQALESKIRDGNPALTGFYQNAFDRDSFFIKKILNRMHPASRQSMIVSGGFHTQELKKLIKKSNMNYVIISPLVTDFSKEDSYQKQMKGDVSWLKGSVLKNQKADVFGAFSRKTVQKLLGAYQKENPSEAPEGILKLWRDELLRKLAFQGRLGQAELLTPFLDDVLAQQMSAGQLNIWKDKWTQKVDHFLGQLQAARVSAAVQPASSLTAPWPHVKCLEQGAFNGLNGANRSEIRSGGGSDFYEKMEGDIERRALFNKGVSLSEISRYPLDDEDKKSLLGELSKIEAAVTGTIPRLKNVYRNNLTIGIATIRELLNKNHIYVSHVHRWSDAEFYLGGYHKPSPENEMGVVGKELIKEDPELALFSLLEGFYQLAEEVLSPEEALTMPEDFDEYEKLNNLKYIYGDEKLQDLYKRYLNYKNLDTKEALVRAARTFGENFSPGSNYFKTANLFREWQTYYNKDKTFPIIQTAAYLSKKIMDLILKDFNGFIAQEPGQDTIAAYARVVYPYLIFCLHRTQIAAQLKTEPASGDSKIKAGLFSGLANNADSKSMVQNSTFSTLRDRDSSIHLPGPVSDTAWEPQAKVYDAAVRSAQSGGLSHVAEIFRGQSLMGKIVSLEIKDPSSSSGYWTISDSAVSVDLLLIFSGIEIFPDFITALLPRASLPVYRLPVVSGVAGMHKGETFRVIRVTGQPMSVAFLPVPETPISHGWSYASNDWISQINDQYLWIFISKRLMDFDEDIRKGLILGCFPTLMAIRKNNTLPSSKGQGFPHNPDGIDMKTWVDNVLELQMKEEINFWKHVEELFPGGIEEYVKPAGEQFVSDSEAGDKMLTHKAIAFWYYHLFVIHNEMLAGIADGLTVTTKKILNVGSLRLLIDGILALMCSGPPRADCALYMQKIMRDFLEHVRLYPERIYVEDLEKLKKFLRGQSLSSEKITFEQWYAEGGKDFDFDKIPASSPRLVDDGGQFAVIRSPARNYFAPDHDVKRIARGNFLNLSSHKSTIKNYEVVWVGTSNTDGVAIPGTNLKLLLPDADDNTKLYFVLTLDHSKNDGERESSAVVHVKKDPDSGDSLAQIPLMNLLNPFGSSGTCSNNENWYLVPNVASKADPDKPNAVLPDDGLYQLGYPNNNFFSFIFDKEIVSVKINQPLPLNHKPIVGHKSGEAVYFYSQDLKTYLGSISKDASGKWKGDEMFEVLEPLKRAVDYFLPPNEAVYSEYQSAATAVEELLKTGRGYRFLRINTEWEGDQLELSSGTVTVSPALFKNKQRLKDALSGALKEKDPFYQLERKALVLKSIFESKKEFTTPSSEIPSELDIKAMVVDRADFEGLDPEQVNRYQKTYEEIIKQIGQLAFMRRVDEHPLFKGRFRKELRVFFNSGTDSDFLFASGGSRYYELSGQLRGSAYEGVGRLTANDIEANRGYYDFRRKPLQEENPEKYFFVRFREGSDTAVKIAIFDLKSGEPLDGQTVDFNRAKKERDDAFEKFKNALPEPLTIDGSFKALDDFGAYLNEKFPPKDAKALESQTAIFEGAGQVFDKVFDFENYDLRLNEMVLAYVLTAHKVFIQNPVKGGKGIRELHSYLGGLERDVLFYMYWYFFEHDESAFRFRKDDRTGKFEEFFTKVFLTIFEKKAAENKWLLEKNLESIFAQIITLADNLKLNIPELVTQGAIDGNAKKWINHTAALTYGYTVSDGALLDPSETFFLPRNEPKDEKPKEDDPDLMTLNDAERRGYGYTVRDLSSRAGNCLLIEIPSQSNGSTRLIIDAGISQTEASETYDRIETVPDFVIITHAHRDHYQSIFELNRRFLTIAPGKRVIFVMTPATKEFIQMRSWRGAEDLTASGISLEEFEEFFAEQIQTFNFETPVRVSDNVIFQFSPAGHILGAASVVVLTPFGNMLVTGDFSTHDVGPVKGLTLPEATPIHVVLTDSSLADLNEERSRADREKQFLDRIREGLKPLENSIPRKVHVAVGSGLSLPVIDLIRREGIMVPIYVVGRTLKNEIALYRQHFPDVIFDVRAAERDFDYANFPHSAIILSSAGGEVAAKIEALLFTDPANTLMRDRLNMPETLVQLGRSLGGTNEKVEHDPTSFQLSWSDSSNAAPDGARLFPLDLYNHALLPDIVDLLSKTLPKVVMTLHARNSGRTALAQKIHGQFPRIKALTSTGNPITIAPLVSDGVHGGPNTMSRRELEEAKAFFNSRMLKLQNGSRSEVRAVLTLLASNQETEALILAKQARLARSEIRREARKNIYPLMLGKVIENDLKMGIDQEKEKLLFKRLLTRIKNNRLRELSLVYPLSGSEKIRDRILELVRQLNENYIPANIRVVMTESEMADPRFKGFYKELERSESVKVIKHSADAKFRMQISLFLQEHPQALAFGIGQEWLGKNQLLHYISSELSTEDSFTFALLAAHELSGFSGKLTAESLVRVTQEAPPVYQFNQHLCITHHAAPWLEAYRAEKRISTMA